MKLSIIIGVTHMSLGLFLKGVNAIYFGDLCDFIFGFLPEIVFMMSTFGYMCFCIIIKWLTNWEGRHPPAIINLFIEFVQVPEHPLYGSADGMDQHNTQMFLAKLAACTIPLMLFVKPCYQNWQNNKAKKIDRLLGPEGPKVEQKFQASKRNIQQVKKSKFIELSDPDLGSQPNPNFMNEDKGPRHQQSEEIEIDDRMWDLGCEDTAGQSKAPPLPFSELMILQSIHTIEFVLGCVSNTASYLRLWALSLAHVELTHVFLDLTLNGFGVNVAATMSGTFCSPLKEKDNGTMNQYCHATFSSLTIFLVFPMLVVINVGLIMFVDCMECFLHTLRLHWVEFQNKFYKGDGRKFVVFSLEQIAIERVSERASRVR